jgi:hypothetical protein
VIFLLDNSKQQKPILLLCMYLYALIVTVIGGKIKAWAPKISMIIFYKNSAGNVASPRLDRWQRHPVHSDARQSGREEPVQGAGTAAVQAQPRLLDRPGRQRHVELKEARLVSGVSKTVQKKNYYNFP